MRMMEANIRQFFDRPSDDGRWKTHEGPLEPRPRPVYTTYQNKSVIQNLIMLSAEATEQFEECLLELQDTGPGWDTYTNACFVLALHAQKDMSWSKVLK